MKHLLIGLWLSVITSFAIANTDSLSVMTYNIRCGYCEPIDSPNHWSKRKFLVAHLITNHNPDIIGFQEAELFQVEDLASMLGDYVWFGVGRDDGDKKGEANVIFLRKSRFILQESNTLWLSATPQQISKGWDARYNRTLTMLNVKDKQTGHIWHLFNTHFDHEGVEAQKNGARLLLKELKKPGKKANILVTGDFNLTNNHWAYKHLTDSGLIEDAETIAITKNASNLTTYNDFGKNTESNKKIDFIFVSKHLKVPTHLVDQTRYNELFPSDHYPVIVQISTKE